jgi:glycosyltransferase involved in cell wall biosynthesis
MGTQAAALLHRHVWQRIPRAWRRSALFHATSFAAPRPQRDARAGHPIIVAGALTTASGLGYSARLCHDALKQAGVPVFGIDLTDLLRQVPDLADFSFVDGRALTGPGTIILHVNSPTVPLAMWKLGRRLVEGKRVIGCWAWELPEVPGDWRHGIDFVHEIWTPSTFVADAVRPIAEGRPVQVIPYAVALRGGSAGMVARVSGTPFTVLTVFNMSSSYARKNPCAAIAAFQAAFGADPTARLIVKLANAGTYPQGLAEIRARIGSASNILIIEDTLPADELTKLVARADVLISLHRSEGFGLTLAEAMLSGVPVVATGWSGNADFLNADTGLPVPYQLVPAIDPQGSYHHPDLLWAEADVGAAAQALRRLRDDPALRVRLTKRAALDAAQSWSAQRYALTVQRLLGI